MRALVTGGHGFVGSHLVRALLDAGTEVRCAYRRDGRPQALEGLPVEVVRADVRDPVALAAAVEGVDEIHHLAGLTRSRTRAEMLGTNHLGTARILTAARETGFSGRFVLCSSLAAVGPSGDGVPRDVDAPPAPLTWYGESKVLAEAEVRAHAEHFETTIVRPPAVYGPGDEAFLGLFKAVRAGLGPVVGAAHWRYSLVHAADLASGWLAVARHPDMVGRVAYL